MPVASCEGARVVALGISQKGNDMHTPTLTLTMAGEVGIWNYTGLITLTVAGVFKSKVTLGTFTLIEGIWNYTPTDSTAYGRAAIIQPVAHGDPLGFPRVSILRSTLALPIFSCFLIGFIWAWHSPDCTMHCAIWLVGIIDGLAPASFIVWVPAVGSRRAVHLGARARVIMGIRGIFIVIGIGIVIGLRVQKFVDENFGRFLFSIVINIVIGIIITIIIFITIETRVEPLRRYFGPGYTESARPCSVGASAAF